MTRSNRIAILAALVLLILAAGTVMGTRAPQAGQQPAGNQQDGEEEAPPDADAVTHALDRLAANEITAEEGPFTDLASRYGLGGAVRLYAWSKATGQSVENLADLRDGDGTTPVGWGRLAKDLGVHPGIGSIMGNGRAPDVPPGQQDDREGDEGD